MKKFVVYFTSFIDPVGSYIHVFANSAEEAVRIVEKDGVGYYNGPVYVRAITGVAEVEFIPIGVD